MVTAEELLASLAEGNRIIIDENRNIKIPEKLKRIAVQFDHNIETVTFDCPRYWDGHDLSQMYVYINYMRADGEMGSYICDTRSDETDENTIHFDWTISEHVSAVKGKLSFLVCAKDTDAEGNATLHWNSEINQDMYVSAGLETQETVLNQHPDIITQLLSSIDKVRAIVSPTVTFNATIDGYRITVTDSNGSKTYTIKHGDRGLPGEQGVPGEQGAPGEKGTSIVSITRTTGTGTSGSTDTYTITLSDGSTHEFKVYNGKDGDGAGDMVSDVYDPQGKARDIFKYVDESLPVKVNILETICENITLNDENPSYTLPAEITLDYEALYYVACDYYMDGIFTEKYSQYMFNIVSDGVVRWFSHDESHALTLTTTEVINNWRDAGESTIISIYKVEISREDRMALAAANIEGFEAFGVGGYFAHAEGYKTLASGYSAHAEGSRNVATGGMSHVEGSSNVASGSMSHAEGQETQAIGEASHAEGYGTVAGSSVQHVQGQHNIPDYDDKYLHIVGNGTEDAPSNAHTLDRGGNAWFSGDVSDGSGHTLSRMANPNLLHNWYFANPVNQRGFTSKTSSQGYFVDRWNASTTAATTISVEDDGLSIVNESTGTSYIRQYFEIGQIPTGTYTISVLAENVVGKTVVVGRRTDGGWTSLTQIENGLTTHTVTVDTDMERVQFQISGGASLKINAVKLELGSVQTLAHQEKSTDGDVIWVLNEISDYNEELLKCCLSRADLSDTYANNRAGILPEAEYRLMSQRQYADEMIAVAKSYLEKDAEYFAETGERYFSYSSDYTCFTYWFGNQVAENLNNIDCSVYLSLVIRGIPFSKSPYALPFSERANWDPTSIKANTDDYDWAVDPGEWQTSRFKDDAPTDYDEYAYRVRKAGQLAEWLTTLGCAFSFAEDFHNVEPGDIIFYTGANTTTEYEIPNNYKHIAHVAFCATKESVEEGDVEFANYPYKHQIYDSTFTSDTGTQTFFYEDDGNGGVKSTRYLESATRRIILICRPSFLARESGAVTPISDGGTGARSIPKAMDNFGAAYRPNLLVNGYFLNPVNQRGKAQYLGTTDTGTIDKWRLYNTNGGVATTDSGIVFTNTSTNVISWGQKLENYRQFVGRALTVSILVTEVSGTIGLALRGKESEATVEVQFSAPGLYSLTRTIPDDADQVMVFLVPRTAGVSATIAAVKLELGSTQSLAHQDASGNWVLNDVSDYAEELWKCQRYYQLFSSADKRPTALIDYRPTMAAEPTLGTIDIDGTTYYYAAVSI